MTTIGIDKLHSSPFNRRREWGDIEGLAASIKTDGILEPILVRARRDGGYELIAGERRLQAAKLCGMASVPACVLEANDEEAMRISAVENLQRENPHPLDETDSYRDLQRENKANTVPVIAALVGKPPAYIYRRLKLTYLHKQVRESFERNEITVAHAELLARLDPKQQQSALAEACCFQRTLFEPGSYKPTKCPVEPAPLGELDAWIQLNTKVDPGSPDTPQYFPEVADAFEHPDTLLQLSASDIPGAQLQDKKHGLVGTRRWVRVKGKACKYSRKGVIVHGGPLTILDVCISKLCGKHHPKKKAVAGSGPVAVDQQTEAAQHEATWKYNQDMRDWYNSRQDAIGSALMRVALDHVPADAITPAFGRLILGMLSTFSLKVDMCTTSTLPPNGDGTINIPELTDTQVVTVIVMVMAKGVIGWYAQNESDEKNYAEGVEFLAGLGVTDPTVVISGAAKAFADVNPKPKQPRAKKAVKKKAAPKKKATKKAAKKGAK